MRYMLLCLVVLLSACVVEEEIEKDEPVAVVEAVPETASGMAAFTGHWTTTFQGRKIVIEIPEEGAATITNMDGNQIVEKIMRGNFAYDPELDQLTITTEADTPSREILIHLRKPRNELVVHYAPRAYPEQGLTLVVAAATPEEIAALPQEVSSQPPSQMPPAARAARLRASCQNNLKQMGLVFKMYAHESKGDVWPALDFEKGRLTPLWDIIYPEYLTDTNVMICPADSEGTEAAALDSQQRPSYCIDDHSYWYFGYALPDEATALAFLEHYRQVRQSGGNLTDDIALEGDAVIHCLKEGVERILVTDVNTVPPAVNQSKIPVLVERPGNHEQGGNVLFMDGHVEFIKYPGKYPMTEKVIEALLALDVKQ